MNNNNNNNNNIKTTTEDTTEEQTAYEITSPSRPHKRQRHNNMNTPQHDEQHTTSTSIQQPHNATSTEIRSDDTSSSSSSTSTSTSTTIAATSAPPVSATSQPASQSSAATQSKPSKSCLLRLQSDYKSLENDPPEGVSASPVDSTLLHWKACIFGPSDSEWEGGIFQMQINFPLEYPQKPPSVRFISKIFHPNVFADGNLCLDIIQDHWSPIYTVSTILTSIQSLLTDPNPASPANPEAAKLWASDKKEYRKRVRACVAKCST